MPYVKKLHTFSEEDLIEVRKYRAMIRFDRSKSNDPEIIKWVIYTANKYTGSAIGDAGKLLETEDDSK